jgi:hypothetical protein
MTFDDVRKIALALEHVEESTSYGTPAFKVRGKLVARLREDGETLVVGMDFDQREELLAAEPDTYYLTDHYRNYPWILVRLPRVHPDALRDLLRGAERLASVQASRNAPSAPRRRANTRRA